MILHFPTTLIVLLFSRLFMDTLYTLLALFSVCVSSVLSTVLSNLR